MSRSRPGAYICIYMHSCALFACPVTANSRTTHLGLATRSGLGFTDALNLLKSLDSRSSEGSTRRHRAWTSQWLMMYWSSGSPIDDILFKDRNRRNGCDENDKDDDKVIAHFARTISILSQLRSTFELSHPNFHVEQVIVQFCLTPERRNARRRTHQVYLITTAVEMKLRNLISVSMRKKH